jgi:hypothetical protein
MDAYIAWVVVFGLIGGFVHDVINGSIEPPFTSKNDSHLALKLGTLGNIIIGAVAAFVVYGSQIVTSTEEMTFLQVSILALTAGIGGGAILNSFTNKLQTTVANGKLAGIRGYVQSHIQASGKPVTEIMAGPGPSIDAVTLHNFIEDL